LGIFITFNFISFTRIWFRTGSANTWEEMQADRSIVEEWFTANAMLNRLLTSMDLSLAPQIIAAFGSVFAVMAFGMIVHWLPSRWKDRYRDWFANQSLWFQVLLCVAGIVLVYQVLKADMQPFIYFQF
jgi:vacuolar-type H+-ATPase subunit I/STV1